MEFNTFQRLVFVKSSIILKPSVESDNVHFVKACRVFVLKLVSWECTNLLDNIKCPKITN